MNVTFPSIPPNSLTNFLWVIRYSIQAWLPARESGTTRRFCDLNDFFSEEDFLILGTDTNYDGSWLIEAECISELVKGRRFVFDTRIDGDIQAVDLMLMRLEPDRDSGYRKKRLLLETQIRNAV